MSTLSRGAERALDRLDLLAGRRRAGPELSAKALAEHLSPSATFPKDVATTPAREAACSCRQLRLTVEGEPELVSLCHCLACQRRTGSAFGVQAAFTSDQVHPAPTVAIHGSRRHPWLAVTAKVKRYD